ncbi:hypothetical protein LMB96_05365 [Limosilactobacillus reuteri]|uniref:hypothetical protein n=1 Tax=Limosilactobacillus reuteri TaxID=1598 RepID=UPI001E30893A|nr:hypothetical protein [Limosilactobacillus reuteri]MCC4421762.1 hypothetical protein [Limosilactobacillus reuteri]
MKIKEAIEIINGTTSTVSAKYLNNALRISSKNTEIYGDWFLKMPMNAISWESIRKEWGGLSPNIKAKDLARVMDVVQRLLDTPVKDRFPEKKYTIQVIANYDSAYLNCRKEDNSMTFCDDIETDHVKTRFTQTEIDELKQRPDLAIDWDKAIIKEFKDDED